MRRFLFLFLLISSLQAFSEPLIVGSIALAPPFSSVTYTNNKPFFFGFSIDIMNQICRKINRQCIYQPLPLDAQLNALDKGKVDVLLLASPYRSEDLKTYTVSIPYLLSKIRFIARSNDSIISTEEIQNKKISVHKNTFYKLLLNSPFHNKNSIIPYQDVNSLVNGLIAKDVDLIVLNQGIANYYINNNYYSIKTVGDEIELGTGYGIISLKENTALINAINQAIESLLKDGSYLAIYKKYFN